MAETMIMADIPLSGEFEAKACYPSSGV